MDPSSITNEYAVIPRIEQLDSKLFLFPVFVSYNLTFHYSDQRYSVPLGDDRDVPSQITTSERGLF